MTTYWNFRKALNLNPRYGSQLCVGWAPSKGRECHWKIERSECEEANRILDRMNQTKRLDDAIENLEDLAHMVLCNGWHSYGSKSQVSTVVPKWERIIREKLREPETREPRRNTQRKHQDLEEPYQPGQQDLEKAMRFFGVTSKKVENPVMNQVAATTDNSSSKANVTKPEYIKSEVKLEEDPFIAKEPSTSNTTRAETIDWPSVPNTTLFAVDFTQKNQPQAIPDFSFTSNIPLPKHVPELQSQEPLRWTIRPDEPAASMTNITSSEPTSGQDNHKHLYSPDPLGSNPLAAVGRAPREDGDRETIQVSSPAAKQKGNREMTQVPPSVAEQMGNKSNTIELPKDVSAVPGRKEVRSQASVPETPPKRAEEPFGSVDVSPSPTRHTYYLPARQNHGQVTPPESPPEELLKTMYTPPQEVDDFTVPTPTRSRQHKSPPSVPQMDTPPRSVRAARRQLKCLDCGDIVVGKDGACSCDLENTVTYDNDDDDSGYFSPFKRWAGRLRSSKKAPPRGMRMRT